MTDLDTFRRLSEEASVIRQLPPLPFFDATHEALSMDLIAGGIPYGSNFTTMLELLVKTVQGNTWQGDRTETFKTERIVDGLLTVGALDREEMFSCLVTVAAGELDLSAPDRAWWILHRSDVCRPFQKRGVVGTDLPEPMLEAMISAENWENVALSDDSSNTPQTRLLVAGTR